MRKVFALLAGLFLLSLFAACSEDSTPTPPAPPSDLSVLTSTVPVGYTCTPYSVQLEAEGGKGPYTWSLVSGSSLPDGLVLSADGRITGLVMITGDYTFTVRVTDSSDTPKTDEQEFTMNLDVPSNPSLAIFYDTQATVCSSELVSWTPLTCYVFIMLDNSDVVCAQACEFKLRLTDVSGADLDAGTEYAILNTQLASCVTLSLGDLFNGIAMSFNRAMYGPEPIHIASFGLLLLEDLQDLSFRFDANPGGSLAVASCVEGFPMVEVFGRAAALNY